MAVGAHPGRLVAEIAGGGARFGLWGVAVGLVMAVPAGFFLGKIFRGVEPWDPLVFGGVVLLLLATSTLATGVAGRRAARVNPVVTLSAE